MRVVGTSIWNAWSSKAVQMVQFVDQLWGTGRKRMKHHFRVGTFVTAQNHTQGMLKFRGKNVLATALHIYLPLRT